MDVVTYNGSCLVDKQILLLYRDHDLMYIPPVRLHSTGIQEL
jgi:hypothetical protein